MEVAAWAAGGAALATLYLLVLPTLLYAHARACRTYDRVASCEDTVQDTVHHTVHYPLQYAMCSGERHDGMCACVYE